MCRLVAYFGPEILLEDILVNPDNSLIQQSLHARDSRYPTNGDGFGVGWYNHQISPNPGLFTSISPAWNDQNLLHLASKIKSSCFFGHVRAASAGGVTHYNCHPFINENWMFMHNGGLNDFIQIKRHIRHLLEDDIYNWIKGETDSEHLFALFRQMAKGRDLSNFCSVIQLTLDVINQLQKVMTQFGKPGASYLNICVTDGKRLIASRYCTDRRYRPESMYYSLGKRFALKDQEYHMIQGSGKPECALVASEVLNGFNEEWHEVPEHHLLLINENLDIELYPLP